MPDVVAGKARAKSRRLWWRFHQKQRLGEKRGQRIDRHPMGRCRRKLSHIVDGHVDNDILLCGGPIGAKRRQKSRSSVIFRGFWPFSQRDAAQLLPRLFEPVARLLWPFFVSGFVAGGCPGAERGPLFPKKLTPLTGSTNSGCGKVTSPPGAAPLGRAPICFLAGRRARMTAKLCEVYEGSLEKAPG